MTVDNLAEMMALMMNSGRLKLEFNPWQKELSLIVFDESLKNRLAETTIAIDPRNVNFPEL